MIFTSPDVSGIFAVLLLVHKINYITQENKESMSLHSA